MCRSSTAEAGMARHSAILPCRRRRIALLLLAGLIAAVFYTHAAQAQNAAASGPSISDPFDALVSEASQRFGIPAAWIRAVIRVESGGDQHAVSSAGALGLMQIMPQTWTGLRESYGLGNDPFDPRDNILAGAAFLREMHDRYGSAGFLAAYNCGPACYDDHLATGRPLPPETVAYVAGLLPLLARPNAAWAALRPVSDGVPWTQAPLFARQFESASSGTPALSIVVADAAQSSAPVHDLSAIETQSEGLFVTFSVARRTP